MAMVIERILITLLTNLGSYFLTKSLQGLNRKESEGRSEEQIDSQVEQVRDALVEATDGKPLTAEQRKNFNLAIRNLIRGNGSRRM
jgi:hypothetical protein